MKTIYYIAYIAVAALFVGITSCGQVKYDKTESGLLYKIIPGKGKDSLVKEGKIVKFEYVAKLKDSVIYSSYGKMPGYVRIQPLTDKPYNLLEVLPKMRKGDSAVTVQVVDTLIKRGLEAQMPSNAKKGDRITTTLRITEVFSVDSIAMADYNKEMEKDRPRQIKEQAEQIAKMRKESLAELEKSGEAAKQRKIVEDYLAGKNVKAQKTENGTYIFINEQGSGPKVEAGKFITIKYAGRRLATDSVFESNTYPGLQIGVGNVIGGWDEGLLLFNEGGKGTLYVPGYMAYGKNPRPGGPIKADDALIFDVEILKVSDKPEPQQ